VNLQDGKLKIVQDAMIWPAGQLRRASVNSFGYGGANAHTIFEAIEHLAPGCGGIKAKARENYSNGFVNGHGNSHLNDHTNGHSNGHTNGYSNGHSNGITNGHTNGTNSQSIKSRGYFLLPFSAHNEQTLGQNIVALRDQVQKYDLLDLAYTLGCRRSKLSSRTYAVASDDTILDSLNVEGLVMSKAMGSRNLKLGFVFTGNYSDGKYYSS
jgi:acyl transferase domain-containing protein